jgi:phenylalanine-4-hydroxylase
VGRLFSKDCRLYIYPRYDENQKLLTAANLDVAPKLKHLYQYLLDNYFIIDSFRQLFDETYEDFTPVYRSLAGKPEHEPGVIVPGDKVAHEGTGVYAIEADKRRAERAGK